MSDDGFDEFRKRFPQYSHLSGNLEAYVAIKKGN
jgi:hypothetical protein